MNTTVPTGLRARYGGRERRGGIWTLVAVVVAAVVVASIGRGGAGLEFLRGWVSAALPAAGFAVAGVLLGHAGRSRALLARRPLSTWRLGRLGARAAAQAPGNVACALGGAAVSPFVLVAAWITADGRYGLDGPILWCAWLFTSLSAAAVAVWAILPVLGRTDTPPVGEVRVVGEMITLADQPDLLVSLSIALRSAVVGTAVMAALAAVPGDATVSWLHAHPAVAAFVGVLVAFVAAPGAEAGCLAAGALVVFGPAAVIGAAATAVVCDTRMTRELQRLVAPGLGWRGSAASLSVCLAGGVWTGVLLA